MWRRLISLFLAGLVIAAGISLYLLAHRVDERRARIAALHAEIAREQANIRILEAEWAYLTSPERIRMDAERYLALRPPRMSQQIGDLRSLPEASDGPALAARAAVPVGQLSERGLE
ncbi:MAG: hypothetical protein D6740_00495 [Alphaproteobacteria bacterium]|nr:MAG: hypothetical protein D6740_00495 [Alphaproteobacteria bacterium]